MYEAEIDPRYQEYYQAGRRARADAFAAMFAWITRALHPNTKTAPIGAVPA